MNPQTLKQFVRSNGYAWPGGYPMFLAMADGGVIDAQSARENYRQIRQCMRHPSGASRDWTPIGIDVHWEGGPLQCAHSGREIPSAYGVDE